MRGEALDEAALGWHGLEGDRRYAVRRLDELGGFPWLTASRLPSLILYTPTVPTHVRTPEGEDLPLLGGALAVDIGRRLSSPVEVMQLRHGIFDEASLSVITSDTVNEVLRAAGCSGDARRFRPNVLLRSTRAVPF